MDSIKICIDSLARYQPSAMYFADCDIIEYTRHDSPSVFRRIDPNLSLVLDLYKRDVVGFQFKGLKNFLFRSCNSSFSDQEFIEIVKVIEAFLSEQGENILLVQEHATAYREAIEMARKDNVILSHADVAA